MRILPLTLLVCSVILSDGTMAGKRRLSTVWQILKFLRG